MNSVTLICFNSIIYNFILNLNNNLKMNKKLDRAYYDILEVRKDADAKDIKKAFKKAALSAHPDKGGTDELFQMVNEAF